ncbi:MAG TPA: DUF5362 family protein [Prosthecobacter sp.]|nr:DUF5362 family protein [Prosthecobacter sp.]
MESNPYHSPSASLFGSNEATETITVSQGSILHLQNTRPWALFLSVVFFLVSALMTLFGFGTGAAVVLGAGSAELKDAGAVGPGFFQLIGAVYGLMGVIGLSYIYPGVKLWKYSTRINALTRSQSVQDLESALNAQRMAWKSLGIVTILGIALGILMMIVGVVAGLGVAETMGKGV